jgi:hypothetical protein
MTIHRFLAATMLAFVATAAYAQDDGDGLSPLQVSVGCAVPAALEVPRAHDLLIVGGQLPEPRSVFGPRDLLVINGGTHRGLRLGQRFFVRRPVTYGVPSSRQPRAVRTSGWIRVVALDTDISIAAVDVACADIMRGDYLDLFVAPVVPEGADRADASGEPDFASLGHILFGHDESRTGATGDFMLIDRGSGQGVVPGARMAIYRDHRVADVPLAPIGEGMVISTAPATSLIRVTLARDSIETGDLVVPRKP